MPEAGILEFDYVSLECPGPADTRNSLSDHRVVKMLINMGCAAANEEENLMKKVQKMEKKTRRAAMGFGSRLPHEEMSEKLGLEVVKHLFKLYDPSIVKKRFKKEEELLKDIAKEDSLFNATGEGSRAVTPAATATTPKKKGKGKSKKSSMNAASKAAMASAAAQAVKAVDEVDSASSSSTAGASTVVLTDITDEGYKALSITLDAIKKAASNSSFKMDLKSVFQKFDTSGDGFLFTTRNDESVSRDRNFPRHRRHAVSQPNFIYF
jgi:hypothetical protein